MSGKATNSVTTIGIDIGKNSFHVVGLDSEGSMVLRQKLSRGRVAVRLAMLILSLSTRRKSRHERQDLAGYWRLHLWRSEI